MSQPLAEVAARAAAAIRDAEVIVIGAGAGMGVDSGLPDFRGDQGFWKAYPPYERLGLSFEDAANPEHFEADTAFGWGFYGHRLGLYRATVPHAGFRILRRWIEERSLPSFVFTSNVDGQFQKAGFDPERIVELHGSIHFLQCAQLCHDGIWENRESVDVDETTMRAHNVIACPRCGQVARPNILMFGDVGWAPERSFAQKQRFEAFLTSHQNARIVVVELGAGTAIPSVRRKSEALAQLPGATLVRINPRESKGPEGTISLAAGALAGLQAIRAALAAGEKKPRGRECL
jgi:NAD-dependent SIR2 family protein deacetylase